MDRSGTERKEVPEGRADGTDPGDPETDGPPLRDSAGHTRTGKARTVGGTQPSSSNTARKGLGSPAQEEISGHHEVCTGASGGCQ
jgi:hypothetical protein